MKTKPIDKPGECVREPIRHNEEAIKPLQALYRDGMESGAPVPMTDEDWAELRAMAR